MFLPPFLGGPKDLPESLGPYVPGWLDIRTGSSKEDGVFARIYYPTNLYKSQDNSNSWSTWLPHSKYLEGFAFVLGIWQCLFTFFFKCFAAKKRIPAAKDGQLAQEPAKLKTAVFSHGMSATRFMNSGICCELAAHGYVIASVEHQDGSAAMTCHYPEKSDTPVWHIYDQVPIDTPSEHHLRIRGQQAEQRAEEAGRCLQLLRDLNNGIAIDNKMPTRLDFSLFKDRLDLSSPLMMGHSFGGATTILSLVRNPDFGCGVILDPWMFPIHRYTDLAHQISQPLLTVNMHTFQTPENLRDLDRYFMGEQPNVRTAYTIPNTTHENQSDPVHLIGYKLNMFMSKIDPVLAQNVNNALIIKFLREHNGLKTGEETVKLLDSAKEHVVQGTCVPGVANKKRKIPHQINFYL